MPTDFPTSIDSFARPTGSTKTNAAGFKLSEVIDDLSDAVEAVETVLGAGISTPNGVLRRLAEVTLGSAAATIDFTNIPQTYRHLMIEMTSVNSAGGFNNLMRFSSDGTTFDTGANYDYQFASAVAAAVGAGEGIAVTSLLAGRASFLANSVNPAVMHFSDYTNTTKHKTVIINYGYRDAASSGNVSFAFVSGWWRNTAALKGIRLSPGASNFDVGTRVTLYGVPD